MRAKNNVPAIRFEGFGGEWAENTLGVLTQVIDPHPSHRAPDAVLQGVPFIGIGDISEDGEIDYSNVRIVSHHIYDEHRKRYTLNAGDFAYGRVASIGKIIDLSKNVLSKYTYSPTMALVKPISIDSDYLKGYLHTEIFKNCVDNKTTGSTRKSLGVQHFRELPVFFPEKNEQTKIGTYFQQLDTLIAQHQKKHDKLLNLKKALLEKLFPKQGATEPEIRFKGFSGAWEETILGKDMDVTSVKRIHQSDWTASGIRFLRARDIVSAYKKEEPSDYLYISKEKYIEYSQLSGKVELGDLLVTGVGTIGIPMLITNSEPIYFKDGNIIWFKNENKIDGMFLFYSFIGNEIQTFIKHSAGTGTVGTYTIDSGKKTPIKIPRKKEQTKIGKLFKQLDTLITQHQTQLKKLNNIKQACLEKMFV